MIDVGGLEKYVIFYVFIGILFFFPYSVCSYSVSIEQGTKNVMTVSL